MKMTVEISMYPFQEVHRPLIKDFIRKLNECRDLDIKTSATSTTIVGDYDHLLATLGDLMRWSHETHGRSVFVTKFIPGYEP